MPEFASLPAFDPASLVGATLDGRYLIEEHLATGGIWAVFRARHVYMRKDVALKVLRPDLSASAELVERFRREAEIASSLEHDHIVRVTDFGRSPEGWLFLAMELLFGESLFDRLRREGFLSPEEAVPILWQVCDGLEAAHARGVVHRDLKPENIFLARTPHGREVAKVLDFGIAKMADPSSDSATQAGMVVGTPEYLSPEQATGSAVDGRADIYTMGLIAWRALTGKHPFKADEPRALLMMQATRPVPLMTVQRPDLATYPSLVATVAKACEKDPANRYQTALELKLDFAAGLGTSFEMPPGATPAPSLSYTDLSELSQPSPAPQHTPNETSDTIRLGAAHPVPAGPARVPTLEIPVGAARGALWRLGHAARAHPVVTLVLGASLFLGGAAAYGWALSYRSALRSDQERVEGEARLERERGEATARTEADRLAGERARAEADRERIRPLQEARGALVAGKPKVAQVVLEKLLPRRAADPDVHLLLGHVWQAQGDVTRALDAWTTAQALAPLDRSALDQLAADLARERPLAERAARLLVKGGAASGPSLATAASSSSTLVKLRALAAAREIGPSAKVDVLGGYLALLGDADCDVRKAAAGGLGELGDRKAQARLRQAAAARDEARGLFGVLVRSDPRCGSAEAGEAVRKLDKR